MIDEKERQRIILVDRFFKIQDRANKILNYMLNYCYVEELRNPDYETCVELSSIYVDKFLEENPYYLDNLNKILESLDNIVDDISENISNDINEAIACKKQEDEERYIAQSHDIDDLYK